MTTYPAKFLNEPEKVGDYWDKNAELWFWLMEKRNKCPYRDTMNLPGFLEILPNVSGKVGLDIGCGGGHLTRHLFNLGAKVTGLDISPTFIRLAFEESQMQSIACEYVVGNAADLQFGDEVFDFIVAFNSIMDMPCLHKVFSEAFRVLKPGGFLQFGIPHPCFWSYDLNWSKDDCGKITGLMCSDYFPEGNTAQLFEWMFEGDQEDLPIADCKFVIPAFKRTLADWLNAIADSGFCVEKSHEPRPSVESARKNPLLQGGRTVALNLTIRCRKPFGNL